MTPIANIRRLLRILSLVLAYLVSYVLASRLRPRQDRRLWRMRRLLRGLPSPLAPGSLLAGAPRLPPLLPAPGRTFLQLRHILPPPQDVLAPADCHPLFALLH